MGLKTCEDFLYLGNVTKTLYFLLILIPFIGFGQDESFAGTYERHVETPEGSILHYTLELTTDGSFTFHFYRNVNTAPKEENYYGRGRWQVDDYKTISFYQDSERDFNEKHTKKFTGGKARSNRKSPRYKGPREETETLRLFGGDIIEQGLELTKVSE